MIPNNFTKQPWEKRILSIDATGILGGATITTLECKMYDPDDLDVSTAMIVTSSHLNGVISVTVQAGTTRTTYNLRIRITLNNAEQIEDDIAVKVRERRT